MITTNDTLLCHLMALDELKKQGEPRYKTPELLSNPELIEVGVNETVYIHFIHSYDPEFSLTIETGTQDITLNIKNTISGSSNHIIRCLSKVQIKSKRTPDFFVQLVRVTHN